MRTTSRRYTYIQGYVEKTTSPGAAKANARVFLSVLTLLGHQYMLQRDGFSAPSESIRISDLSARLPSARLFGCTHRPTDGGVSNSQRGGPSG
jgi:hypothetical protein